MKNDAASTLHWTRRFLEISATASVGSVLTLLTADGPLYIVARWQRGYVHISAAWVRAQLRRSRAAADERIADAAKRAGTATRLVRLAPGERLPSQLPHGAPVVALDSKGSVRAIGEFEPHSGVRARALPAEQTPKKQGPAKRSPAKKAAAKKAPARRSAPKKSAAKRAPAKKRASTASAQKSSRPALNGPRPGPRASRPHSALDAEGDSDSELDNVGWAMPELAAPDESEAEHASELAVPQAVPPRTAYARLEAPELTHVGEPISVVVGLAAEAMRGVAGGPMTLPHAAAESYLLSIQVVAEGFELADAQQRWRLDLTVSAAEPYPSAQLALTALPQEQDLRAGQIQAWFAVDGHTVGLATRALVIARSGAAPAPPLPSVTPVQINVPVDLSEPPDLTVRIQKGSLDGHLLWTFDTSLAGIALPDEVLDQSVGSGSSLREFAKRLVQDVNREDEREGIYEFMLGKGAEIADAVPAAFWQALRAIKSKVGSRDVSLFMVSADAYVPWELALMDPPLDPARPPFLGSQVDVGRWFYDDDQPGISPPREVRVTKLAVVSGVYGARPGWRRLPEAEAEAQKLEQLYAAAPHGAAFSAVSALLRADPGADILHFAVHGSYDQSGVQDGIVLVDGRIFTPTHVRGHKLAHGPLVFLNACQVGTGNEVLGDCAGMATAFLKAGAAAVIAPLWSIKDSIASEVALAFYARLSAGLRPAEFVRALRAEFTNLSPTPSATRLAYQFFGHPALRIRNAQGAAFGEQPGAADG